MHETKRKFGFLFVLGAMLVGLVIIVLSQPEWRSSPWYLTTPRGGEIFLIGILGTLLLWVGVFFSVLYKRGEFNSNRIILANLIFGATIVVFDVLRKTVFKDASWNYNYPDHRYVLSLPIIAILLLILYAGMVFIRRLLELSQRKFAGSLYGLTLLIGVVSFLSVPVTTEMMSLTPSITNPSHDFLYHPTVVLVEQGPFEFLRTFHTIPTLPDGDRRESAQIIAEFVSQLEYLPFRDGLATYISEIVTTRHGPVPSFMIAPFLIILGTSPASAVTGAYLLVAFMPVVGYYTFKLYFDELTSRYGSLFIVFSPALYIWLRHKTIPYDSLGALLVAIATYLLLRGVQRDSKPYLSGAGIIFSLAALTKISTLPLLLPYLVTILLFTNERVKSFMVFVISSLAVPCTLLLFGYNFIAWYIYDIGRVALIDSGGYSGANSYLNSGILAIGSAWYNTRLLGTQILVLAVAVVLLLPRIINTRNERDIIGLSFVVPVLPFLFLSGMTLSRHLLVIFVPIIFTVLIAVDYLDLDDRFIQSCLAVSGLLLVVNF